jgi:hypothetical protein
MRARLDLFRQIEYIEPLLLCAAARRSRSALSARIAAIAGENVTLVKHTSTAALTVRRNL